MLPCNRNALYTAISERYHSCSFDSHDITSSLDSSSNEALAPAVDSTQIFSCSYVIAETAVELQKIGFGFFRELFSETPNGVILPNPRTAFGSTFSTWCRGTTGTIAIPHILCNKSCWQLGLLKCRPT